MAFNRHLEIECVAVRSTTAGNCVFNSILLLLRERVKAISKYFSMKVKDCGKSYNPPMLWKQYIKHKMGYSYESM